MKNNRIALLIKLLSKYDAPVNSKEICEHLKIKPRTLREDITKYRDELLQHGIELTSKHGVGYSLTILDDDKYYALLKSLMKAEHQQYFVLPVHSQERINFLIRTFLSADEYLKLDDIADEIYISRSTLNNYLKSAREELERFNLELISKPAYGVKIKGNELDLRRAIARYFFYDDIYQHVLYGDTQESETRQQIRDILITVLSQSKLKLTDIGFQNLIIHLEIALMRITKSNYCNDIADEYLVLQQRDEYRVANELVEQIEQVFQVQIPPSEIYFITIHLMGKRSFNHDNAFIITPDIEQLFQKIFKRIDEVCGINLVDDFELYTLLALHFRPMLDRLAYKLNINNPVLDQIKEENMEAFEIAVLAGQVIHQETGLEINEAEIGYMAVHFALAIDRKKNIYKKHNIIVVCASGMGSSQLLLYKIKQRFGQYLNQIKVVQLYELKAFNQKEYDFIISTVDIPFQTDIRILRVHYFMDSNDEIKMENYFNSYQGDSDLIHEYFYPSLFFTHLKSQERYGLIEEFCRAIERTVTVSEDFAAAVIEREKFSSTELGNQIAFPHPIHPCGNKTFVAIAVLDKPIKWDKQMVRYLFMLNVRKDENDSLQLLYESLVTLMSDQQRLKQLEDDNSFDNFILLIKQIINNTQPSEQNHSFK